MESYNCEHKELFLTAHPSLLQFAATIEELSREKARILEDICKKNYIPLKKKIRSRKIPVSCKQFNPK